MRALLAAAALLASVVAQGKVDYQADVKFAIDAIDKECGALLAIKKIDWKKVTDPLLTDSKKTKNDEQHLLMMWRLLARLQDGHAAVRPLERGKDVKVDMPERSHVPGMFLCRAQGKVWIKNAWGAAEAAGLAPGMEVVSLGGKPAEAWLQQRTADLADLQSFSTQQQAAFYTCHWGLADVAGTRLDVEVKEGSGKKKRTITFAKGSQVPPGPAFPPAGLRADQDVSAVKTRQGFGYVHVRRCKEDLPAQMDRALEELGEVRGLILDFRGNSGGGFDDDALFGRFVPAGKTWNQYKSAGPKQYIGPMVVIVDATVRSAGETASGMFAEDGRAWLIGESATAGMSSQKTTIKLPSQLFELYVSVASNKGRFQKGKGLEGIGMMPQELVPFDPKDLAAKVDTQIARAEALLTAFPPDKVRYDPEQHGWKPPK